MSIYPRVHVGSSAIVATFSKDYVGSSVTGFIFPRVYFSSSVIRSYTFMRCYWEVSNWGLYFQALVQGIQYLRFAFLNVRVL